MFVIDFFNKMSKVFKIIFFSVTLIFASCSEVTEQKNSDLPISHLKTIR